ncbi:MAG: nuclear transport factor 2 family protein [Vicinamibacteria bacterium]
MPSPQELALLFVDAVNRQNLARMGALMGENHRLTDSLGRVVDGREAVLAAWKAYFRWMPDYRIEVREVLSDRELVGVFGVAGGTFAPNGELIEENRWELPAVSRAVAIDGLVESWQVYADNKPVYEIMGRSASQ